MDNLSYATSTAISPSHFRLVKALEASKSENGLATPKPTEEQIIVQELSGIKSRWIRSGSALSSAQVRHDLIIALYCASQRPLSTFLPISTPSYADHITPLHESQAQDELFSLEWALPGAVKLAGGGGGATLAFRRTGYRACDEIFTEQPNELKLLLINTICSDLNAHHSLPNAEARWEMGLKAASSPRLATAELVPAIADRVLDLCECRSGTIQRQALATLLALLRLPSYKSDSLLARTRQIVLSKIEILRPSSSSAKINPKSSASSPSTSPFRPSPRSSSSSNSSSVSINSALRQSNYKSQASLSQDRLNEQDPRLFLGLVRAISRKSILYPLSSNEEESRSQVLKWLLSLLERLRSKEWTDTRHNYHGVQCGWLAVAVLQEIALWLPESEEEEQTTIVCGVLDFTASILDGVDLAFGLILASVDCLSPLSMTSVSDSLDKGRKDTVNQFVRLLAQYLKSKNANLKVLVLECLLRLPKRLWTGGEVMSVGANNEQPVSENGLHGALENRIEAGNGWDEESWATLMLLLGSRDPYLRKLTIQVLEHVDPKLTQLHVKRLFANLAVHRKSRIQRNSVIERLLEVSHVVDQGPEAWSQRVFQIVKTVREGLDTVNQQTSSPVIGETRGSDYADQEVIQSLVLRTIDRYAESTDYARAEFAALLMKDGTWKRDLSCALLFAATAGGGATSALDRLRTSETMGKFLDAERSTSPHGFIHLVQQPFLLSILRLLSQIITDAQSFEQLDSYLQSAASLATHSSRSLFALYFRCRKDPSAQSALIMAGRDRRSSTLPGFYTALERYLSTLPSSISRHPGQATKGTPDPSQRLQTSRLVSPSVSSSAGSPASSRSPSSFATPPLSSVSTHVERTPSSSLSASASLAFESTSTPSPTDANIKPLRYQAYESPISVDRCSPSPRNIPSIQKVRDPPRFSRQREMDRERRERGGKGSRMAQSLMTPGALAMIGLEQDLDDEYSGTDDDDESHRGAGAGAGAEEEDGRRSLTPVQSLWRGHGKDTMHQQTDQLRHEDHPTDPLTGVHGGKNDGQAEESGESGDDHSGTGRAESVRLCPSARGP